MAPYRLQDTEQARRRVSAGYGNICIRADSVTDIFTIDKHPGPSGEW